MVVVVVGVRLLAPLVIARYPVPGIVSCLVIDAADQSVFQAVTDVDLHGYQAYDKALDVYYLTLAYLSTIRNWAGGPDFVVGQGLWYFRLIGVAIFEATSARWVLLVFPNTFEYYFIAIEVYRMRRDSNRLTLRQVSVVAAVIWVVVKLPQEWWIHIARLDVTDVVKETLLGVNADSKWWPALRNRPLVPVAAVCIVAAAAFVVGGATRRLPPPLWPATFDADRQTERMGWRAPRRINQPQAFLGWTFAEKVLLVSLVTFIFGRVLPGENARLSTMVAVIAYLIAANTLLSQWLARRGTSWRNTTVEFLVMGAANLAVLVGTTTLAPLGDGSTPVGTTLFLIGLITLVVVLYDRFHAVFADQQRQRLGDRIARPGSETPAMS